MTQLTGTPKRRVAILISGRGSNMKSLVEAARAPNYPAEVAMVVSNRPDALGLEWAKAQGLPTLAMDHTHYEDRAHFDCQLSSVLQSAKIELVALAGFMRLLTESFVAAWHDKLINIHPSLLPAFKGLNTHQRALDAGVRVSGCTVHFVRTEMDVGPIIQQAAVPVLPSDSAEDLAARVLAAEHKIYPSALALVASGQAVVDGDQVRSTPQVNQQQTLFSPPLQ
ncbi:MAG: phosphoribosylglycinamide formyltransferase [Alphaproteobacteria bacterium]|nr:phosphoribosylglycinamide formyltransferase [Alphaproteobacteria bacterium]